MLQLNVTAHMRWILYVDAETPPACFLTPIAAEVRYDTTDNRTRGRKHPPFFKALRLFSALPHLVRTWGKPMGVQRTYGDSNLAWAWVCKAYLAVCVDYRAQKLPGAASSIHSHHAQNLQETKAPQEGGGEDVALAPCWHHRHWGYQYYDVWKAEREKKTALIRTICVFRLNETISNYFLG